MKQFDSRMGSRGDTPGVGVNEGNDVSVIDGGCVREGATKVDAAVGEAVTALSVAGLQAVKAMMTKRISERSLIVPSLFCNCQSGGKDAVSILC